MNPPKRLPAFTLMELTVAMLLAALCSGLAYTAFTFVNRAYKQYDERNKIISGLLTADKLLKQDIDQATGIRYSAEGAEMFNGQGIIRYQFGADLLLRDQYSLRRDTFNLQLSDLHYLFEGSEISEGELADELYLHAVTAGEPVDLTFKKHYSSEELMNGASGAEEQAQ